MKIRTCVSGPSPDFHEAKSTPRNFADRSELPERISSVALGVSGPIAKWQTDFLFDYRIFPAAIMRFEAEWRKDARKMAVGDVILQRAIVPPIGSGLCLEFAVRVTELFEDRNRLGFAYETLVGHAESGVSQFYFEEKDGRLYFTIHTFSEPGHWTAKVAKHVFTLPYQAWCTRRALANVRGHFLAFNPEAERSARTRLQ